jgi:hypothetical protein
VSDVSLKKTSGRLVITETHVRRLCDDALIVASAVRLYVPVKQKRAHTAAARI